MDALLARVAELEAELECQRAAAQELSASREMLQALLSSLPIAVWEIDATGVVTASAGHGLTLMGLRDGQTVGASVRDLYAETPEILAHLERGLRGESFSASNEISGMRFENHYFARRAADGSPAGLWGVTSLLIQSEQVIEERQRAELQLQRKQKQESLAVLAGGIAHDFNNLLVGSLGHADLALRLVHEQSELAVHLREIVRSSERAASLCHQLLAYAGRGSFHIRALDLNQVVEDSMRLIELTLAKTSLLDPQLTPELPPFRGDATQIVQVLINLIKNASDAAEGRPQTIRVTTGMRYVAPSELRLTVVAPDAKPGDYVFVAIRDEGVGMPADVIGRIFDPFFSTKETGRGLGLAAVIGIVRSHAGMLEVESRVGVGTTMVVYLPVSDVAVQPPGTTSSASGKNLADATVLVVDDELSPRRVAQRMLEQAGCHVITAANGREALELFRAQRARIRAVLMDLSMPVMDGSAALRELRTLDRDAKVVLVSGYAEDETLENLAGLKPSAFLLKPYRYEQLIEVLSKVLS